MIYSLIETAKETGLDLFRYPTWVLKTALALDRTVNGWAGTPAPGECADGLPKLHNLPYFVTYLCGLFL